MPDPINDPTTDPDQTLPTKNLQADDGSTLPANQDPNQTAPESLQSLDSLGKVQVEGYEILGTMGRGGMGVVYRARQSSLGRLVALKMILAGGHAQQQDLARFRIEAEAVAHLQHPNIVQIYNVGEQDGLPWFSLELVEGGTLTEKLRGSLMTPTESAELIQKLASAIGVAHEQGIVHRDLKPANVLLTEEGEPKITDFGLAKRLDSEAGQTQSGTILGTPSYMAPEQAQGDSKQVSPATDVYALGAMLYECLTGRPPFQSADVMSTVMHVIHDEPVKPSRLHNRCPKDLELICLKCLEKDPTKRYQNGGELAQELKRFLNHEPIQARAPSVLNRCHRWVRRHPTRATAVGLGILGFVAGLTLLGWFTVYQTRMVDRLAVQQSETKQALMHSKRLSQNLLEEQMMSETRLLALALKERMRQAQVDTFKIVNYPPIPGIVRTWDNGGKDPNDPTSTTEVWLNRLDQILRSQLNAMPMEHLSQKLPDRSVALIDAEGMEVIRVERVNGMTKRVPASRLENVRQMDFFQESKNLKPEQIYVSRLRPMHRGAKTLEELEPMIHVCAPVFDEKGNRKATFTLAVDALPILEGIHATGKSFAALVEQKGVRLHLVDERGVYLYHLDEAKSFANPDDEHGNYHRDHKDRMIPWPAPDEKNPREVQGRLLIRDGRLHGAQQRLFYDPVHPERYWLIDLAIPPEVMPRDPS